MIYPSLDFLIERVGQSLTGPAATLIKPEKWQGLDLQIPMIELFDVSYRVPLPNELYTLKALCCPDLPWADAHFEERVSRNPTNPGDTFKDWPYYKEDDYRKEGTFTHTYQERFWPDYANMGLTAKRDDGETPESFGIKPHFGIRYPYGNLDDVIDHLALNPSTRQAYFPIWFPEDTGVVHNGRVPCSLGYLFSYRNGFLHISYFLRSCDYIRHFRNDLYFAGRLGLWALDELRKKESKIDWNKVQLGRLSLHITSMHIFQTDLYELKKRLRK